MAWYYKRTKEVHEMHKIAYEAAKNCDTLEQFMELMEHHPHWMDISGVPVPEARKDWIIQYWQATVRPMWEVIDLSGMKLAQFAREFYIPKRTVEDWKAGKRPILPYTKMLIQEALGIFQRHPPREAYTGILSDEDLTEAMKNL